MQVDVNMIISDGPTLIGSILISPNGNRLIKQPVKGLEGAEIILTDIVNAPIPVNGKLIRSKDNPKLFLENLPETYNSGYIDVVMSVKKDIDPETVTVSPVLPEGRTSLVSLRQILKRLGALLATRVMQVFRGNPGLWITSKGRRFFLKAGPNEASGFIQKTFLKGEIVDMDILKMEFTQGALQPLRSLQTPIPSLASNSFIKVGLAKFKNGLKGIVRSGIEEVPGRSGAAEVSAFNVARALKWDNLVPLTVRNSRNTGTSTVIGVAKGGSIQQYVPGKAATERYGLIPKLQKLPEKELGRAAIFDYLIANKDRHGGNYFVIGKKLRLIDHEEVFSTLPSRLTNEAIEKVAFHPNSMNADIFDVAASRNILIKQFMGDVNRVNWTGLLRQLKVSKAGSNQFRQRLRLLNEAADEGLNFSSLVGTPVVLKATETLRKATGVVVRGTGGKKGVFVFRDNQIVFFQVPASTPLGTTLTNVRRLGNITDQNPLGELI